MAVKNITSTIKPEKSIMEIEQILAKFGATKILKDYEGERVIALSFCIQIPDGTEIPFRLPMKIEKARTIIEGAVEERKLPKKFLCEPYRTDKAMIVGWRIIKDWIHSQLSLLEIQYANPVEIFLPYAWDPKTNKTLYQKIEDKKFSNLAISFEKKREIP